MGCGTQVETVRLENSLEETLGNERENWEGRWRTADKMFFQLLDFIYICFHTSTCISIFCDCLKI